MLVFASCATASVAGAADLKLTCSANGHTDFSMDVKYRERSGRKIFNASFESAPNLGFAACQSLMVGVGGLIVGKMPLTRDATTGDIIGDLTFDTRPDQRKPFPANFPRVAPTTSVTVGLLGCALR
jgi:hypothetical protein